MPSFASMSPFSSSRSLAVVRHAFQKQLGWIYLAVFCIVRIAGAGFKIESVHHPTNKTDTEWSAILQSVGLGPLLMASMGLLKRMSVHDRA